MHRTHLAHATRLADARLVVRSHRSVEQKRNRNAGHEPNPRPRLAALRSSLISTSIRRSSVLRYEGFVSAICNQIDWFLCSPALTDAETTCRRRKQPVRTHSHRNENHFRSHRTVTCCFHTVSLRLRLGLGLELGHFV